MRPLSFRGEISREERALLAAVCGRLDRENATQADPERLRALARRHCLKPLVRQAWRESFGAEPWENAAEDYRLNVVRGMAAAATVQQLTDTLQPAGIDFRVIKGPGIARRYALPEARHVGDLDILLCEVSRQWEAYDLLTEKGWRSPLFETPLDSAERADYGRQAKDISLHHPKVPVRLEVHWRPYMSDAQAAEDVAMLVAPSRRIQWHGVHFVIPGADAELRYLILHGSLCGWFRLKWLADVVQVVQTATDEERAIFESLMVDSRYGVHYRLLCVLMKRLFDIDMPGSANIDGDDLRRAEKLTDLTLSVIDAPPPSGIAKGFLLDGISRAIAFHGLRARLESSVTGGLALVGAGFSPRDWEAVRQLPAPLRRYYAVIRPLLFASRLVGRKRGRK